MDTPTCQCQECGCEIMRNEIDIDDSFSFLDCIKEGTCPRCLREQIEFEREYERTIEIEYRS